MCYLKNGLLLLDMHCRKSNIRRHSSNGVTDLAANSSLRYVRLAAFCTTNPATVLRVVTEISLTRDLIPCVILVWPGSVADAESHQRVRAEDGTDSRAEALAVPAVQDGVGVFAVEERVARRHRGQCETFLYQSE